MVQSATAIGAIRHHLSAFLLFADDVDVVNAADAESRTLSGQHDLVCAQ
jgi:hypothetical protein